jgi:hypothetical protein
MVVDPVPRPGQGEEDEKWDKGEADEEGFLADDDDNS